MNTFILVIDSDYGWSPQSWILGHGGANMPNGQTTLERQQEWFSVLHDENPLTDFEDSEKEFLSRHIVNPASFLVEWKGNALIEEFLSAIPSECIAFIDNDHGLITSVKSIRDLPIDSWITSELPPRGVE